METVIYETNQAIFKIPLPDARDRLDYLALGLLNDGIGSVICKTCQKEYKAADLHPFQVGFGDNPLAVTFKEKGGLLKRLLRKKSKPIGMSGGKGFKCPEGHELISMITWIS